MRVASDGTRRGPRMPEPSVVILVADGLGTAALAEALAAGELPAIAALAAEGGRFTVTTVFPSVTGVAYVPMLTGRFPGGAGVPGLRWFDRGRSVSRWLGRSRSYVGPQIGRIDADLDPAAMTLAELAGSSLGMQAVVNRGIPRLRRLERRVGHLARATRAHLAGNPAAWTAMEEELAGRFTGRVRRERPRFAFAAFTAGDKAAHAFGPPSAEARRAVALVDRVVAELQADARRDGRWRAMHLWVVSDHGHAPIQGHHELADAVRAAGVRVRSHPWTVPGPAEAAVMVSGNGMAHVYLDLAMPRRPWGALRDRWEDRLGPALDHPAIDLIAGLRSPTEVEVTRRGGGTAVVIREGPWYSYRPLDGDPLGLGDGFEGVDPIAAHERSAGTEYPDAAVQLAALVLSPRAGDLVISAAPGWDLRARWEPVRHVSSHGALHRAHMEVPLVVGRRPASVPRRTVDLFPSALRVLGLAAPVSIDGVAFVR